ncbi:MAG: LamG-like jellyroll fold domain-containing protein [Methylococcaceae bacterium]
MQPALRQILLGSTPKTSFELALKTSLVPEKAVDGTATFTRSSTATYFDSTGVLQTASADSMRFNYNPVALVNNGGLVEGGRTNVILRSEEFDSASWSKTRSSVTTNATVAPDGLTTADKLVEDTSTNSHFCSQLKSVADNTNITVSIYAKAAERNILPLVTSGKDSVFRTSYFNLQTGSVSSQASGHICSIESVGNGWYRCIITVNSGTGASNFGIYPSMAIVSGSTSYAGDGTSGLYIWGSQEEVGDFVSSYIPTTTAAVTRAVDLLSYPTTNINAVSGTIKLEFTPEHTPIGTISLFGSYVDANNYTAILHDSTNLIARKRIAGTNYDATIANPFTSGTTYKVAASWGNNGVNIALNGVLGTSNGNSTAVQLGATVQIGADGNGANQPFSEIKNIKFYKKQLSVSKLLGLTT